MHKSVVTAEFKADIEKVWGIVTDNEHYEWRKDLSRIEIVDEKNFIEYTTADYPTTFTIIEKTPMKKYTFDMKNSNTSGHWSGLFSELPDGGCRVVFTEEIEVKNIFMNILCYLLKPYKKMQERYIYDLKVELGKE